MIACPRVRGRMLLVAMGSMGVARSTDVWIRQWSQGCVCVSLHAGPHITRRYPTIASRRSVCSDERSNDRYIAAADARSSQ